MYEKIVIIVREPAPNCTNRQLREEQRRNLQLVQELSTSAKRLEKLLMAAANVLEDHESADYENSVPGIMSELYFHYLKIAAMRKRLNPDVLSQSALEALSCVWEAQSAAGAALDDLSDLFDEKGDFGEEEDNGNDDDGEDGDLLCAIDINVADGVPEPVVHRVHEGVEAAVNWAFNGGEECPFSCHCEEHEEGKKAEENG